MSIVLRLYLQGLMVAELVLERVAASCQLSPLDVREPLLYREGDVTHFGMVSQLITFAH
jgi:xanthine dehydrogenase molybdopterin-binding subunit B